MTDEQHAFPHDGPVPDAPQDAPADSTSVDAPGAEPPSPDLVTRLQQERDGYLDQLLRKSAEFDNYRKRTERERREQSERAAADLLLDLLPVVDDLERALAAEAVTAEAELYRKGVELILRQILDLLKSRSVRPIDALGADFDPHLHQAVTYEPSAGHRDGEVVEELRKGYLIGERLLRPSMVKVARA